VEVASRKATTRRAFLALAGFGAYFLLDGVLGGPVSKGFRDLNALSSDEQSNTTTSIQHALTKVVALYSDHGTWNDSVIAAQRMFEWMGSTVMLKDSESIDDGTFRDCSILCVPGGDIYQYANDISSSGKESIRDFVRNGGGYIGICGGAYLASEKVIWQGHQLQMTPLGIFAGSAEGPLNEIVDYPNYAMCEVDILNTTHRITQHQQADASMLYYWGPALFPNRDADVTILGKYRLGGQPMMVAFQYGEGRVFLIGTHPEIEENNERDGTAFASELQDSDSEWELMREAALWCLEE
jgi:glutamine amidotransferase-like uncharacterized protein